MLDELIKSDQKEFQTVGFRLGNEHYATLINHVREIIAPQAYTRIPESPHYLKGVINLRGTIIPVIDGRKKFNLEALEDQDSIQEQRIMIMDTEDGTVGLVVDSVLGVMSSNTADIEPPPADLSENSEIFWGILRHSEKLFILIDCYKRTKDEEKHPGNIGKG